MNIKIVKFNNKDIKKRHGKTVDKISDQNSRLTASKYSPNNSLNSTRTIKLGRRGVVVARPDLNKIGSHTQTQNRQEPQLCSWR